MRLGLTTLLAIVSMLAVTASATADPTVSPDERDRRRLEAIEMNAAGDAGVVRTVPEYLGEPDGAYHFGAPRCRGRTLGASTLEQLHLALRTGQLVTIAATEAADGGRCIRAVTFWAPPP